MVEGAVAWCRFVLSLCFLFCVAWFVRLSLGRYSGREYVICSQRCRRSLGSRRMVSCCMTWCTKSGRLQPSCFRFREVTMRAYHCRSHDALLPKVSSTDTTFKVLRHGLHCDCGARSHDILLGSDATGDPRPTSHYVPCVSCTYITLFLCDRYTVVVSERPRVANALSHGT